MLIILSKVLKMSLFDIATEILYNNNTQNSRGVTMPVELIWIVALLLIIVIANISTKRTALQEIITEEEVLRHITFQWKKRSEILQEIKTKHSLHENFATIQAVFSEVIDALEEYGLIECDYDAEENVVVKRSSQGDRSSDQGKSEGKLSFA